MRPYGDHRRQFIASCPCCKERDLAKTAERMASDAEVERELREYAAEEFGRLKTRQPYVLVDISARDL